jgi:putative component of membrane protein insertase Oxa1/YidC/SpoIIIJ protein YidD
MSPLRERLKRPETWLAVLAIAVLLGVVDARRAPADQLSTRAWIAGVHAYRAVGHPLLEGRIQCRYEPTCSEYSIQAVERFGIRRGLAMTFRRLESCKVDVPLGTYDPVPERFEPQKEES